MKGKILVLSLIALGCCSTINAMEIHKGKLLSHKEYTTGKTSVNFKNIKLDVKRELDKFKIKNFLQKNGDDRIYSNASVDSATGEVGEELELTGKSFTFISNQTEDTQTYSIHTTICSTTPYQDYVCGYNEDYISLDPQGFAFTARKPTLLVSYDYAGVYHSAVVTSIQRDNQETTFSSYDMSSVEIFDDKK